MEAFPMTLDLMRLTFLIGAVLALVYKKKLGVTPGGIIVPGFLAVIMFSSFIAFLMVMVATALCMVAYKVFFGRYALTRRWSSLIIISLSVVISLAIMALTEGWSLLGVELQLLTVIIPGLLTISSRNYGHVKVLAGTFFVTAVTGMFGLGLSWVIPNDLLTRLSVELAIYSPMVLDYQYVLLPLSLAVAIATYYYFGLRGGGYLIAPFVAAIILTSPIQALLFMLGVVASYFAIRSILRHTLVIGLERFLLSLFLGYIVVTMIDVLAVMFVIPGYTTTPLVTIIAVAVLTNDLSLQHPVTTINKGIGPAVAISMLAKVAV